MKSNHKGMPFEIDKIEVDGVSCISFVTPIGSILCDNSMTMGEVYKILDSHHQRWEYTQNNSTVKMGCR